MFTWEISIDWIQDWHMAKGECDVICNKDKAIYDTSISSNSSGSLSLFNTTTNTVGNGCTGDNILLCCLLEALIETFFAKMNVRKHKNEV
jgi:hypothetical protein